MKIGIIGYGIVGKSMQTVFEHNAEFYIIDPALNSNTVKGMVETFRPDVAFICVPAPTLDNGTVDASLIYTILGDLRSLSYKGIVVLKSTVTPDIIQCLFTEYQVYTGERVKLVYSPEFVREHSWEVDALSPKMIILSGNWQDCHDLKVHYKRHSHIYTGTEIVQTDGDLASLTKYAINSFLAMKVTFMNQMYQLMGDMYGYNTPIDWAEFVDLLERDGRIGITHMDVPGADGQFGYGGMCFPKDVKALNHFDKEGRLTLLRETEVVNTKIRMTGKIDRP